MAEVKEFVDREISKRGQPKTWDDALDTVQDALFALGVVKQDAYGKDSIGKYGAFGIVVRMWDKFSRLDSLLRAGQDDKQESIEDSFGDLANYACYGVMVRRGWWDLPRAEKGESESGSKQAERPCH